MSRCTGHCCRSFPLTSDPTAYDRLVADPPHVEDGPQLVDMLIPIGPRLTLAGNLLPHFTCRHHDAESGDCKIYDSRPGMCRRYPYGKECEHVPSGCTMRDGCGVTKS